MSSRIKKQECTSSAVSGLWGGVALAMLLVTGGIAAQRPSSERSSSERPSPEKLLEAKLESAFLKKADWEMDYDLALKRAREAKKPILGYFTTAGY